MVGQSPGRARALAAPSPHSNHHAPCNDPSPLHPFPSVRRVARAHAATPARRAAAPARSPAGIERLREPCSGCGYRVLARGPAPRPGLRQDLERRCGALAARPDHRRHRCGDLRLPGQRHDVDPGDERGAGVDRGVRHPELDERVRGHRRPRRLLERGRRHLVDTVVDRAAEPRRARARLRSRRDRRRDQRRSGAEPERDRVARRRPGRVLDLGGRRRRQLPAVHRHRRSRQREPRPGIPLQQHGRRERVGGPAIRVAVGSCRLGDLRRSDRLRRAEATPRRGHLAGRLSQRGWRHHLDGGDRRHPGLDDHDGGVRPARPNARLCGRGRRGEQRG